MQLVYSTDAADLAVEIKVIKNFRKNSESADIRSAGVCKGMKQNSKISDKSKLSRKEKVNIKCSLCGRKIK